MILPSPIVQDPAAQKNFEALAAGGLALGVPNVRTTSYPLALSDAGRVVEMDAASSTVITVPNAPFPVGTVVLLTRIGAGGVAVAPASGVTIHSPGGKLALASQYSSALLRSRADKEWVLAGDLVKALFMEDFSSSSSPLGGSQYHTAGSYWALGQTVSGVPVWIAAPAGGANAYAYTSNDPSNTQAFYRDDWLLAADWKIAFQAYWGVTGAGIIVYDPAHGYWAHALAFRDNPSNTLFMRCEGDGGGGRESAFGANVSGAFGGNQWKWATFEKSGNTYTFKIYSGDPRSGSPTVNDTATLTLGNATNISNIGAGKQLYLGATVLKDTSGSGGSAADSYVDVLEQVA